MALMGMLRRLWRGVSSVGIEWLVERTEPKRQGTVGVVVMTGLIKRITHALALGAA